MEQNTYFRHQTEPGFPFDMARKQYTFHFTRVFEKKKKRRKEKSFHVLSFLQLFSHFLSSRHGGSKGSI